MSSEDDQFLCDDCAWKKQTFEGISPCTICIRNPELVSKRNEGQREAMVQGVKVVVPRDMYVSIDMFEILKEMMTKMQLEITRLTLLLSSQNRRPSKYPEWLGYREKWKVTVKDNTIVDLAVPVESYSTYPNWSSIWKKKRKDKFEWK